MSKLRGDQKKQENSALKHGHRIAGVQSASMFSWRLDCKRVLIGRGDIHSNFCGTSEALGFINSDGVAASVEDVIEK